MRKKQGKKSKKGAERATSHRFDVLASLVGAVDTVAWLGLSVWVFLPKPSDITNVLFWAVLAWAVIRCGRMVKAKLIQVLESRDATEAIVLGKG